MGRVAPRRQEGIPRPYREVLPRLTLDFQTNKKIANEVAIIASKVEEQDCGFHHPLDEGIQRGPVRGISFKLQEEERERKDNYVPEVSALAVETLRLTRTLR
ncbi:ribosomal S17-domain-containing protein, partial [Chytridium lagenaria]